MRKKHHPQITPMTQISYAKSGSLKSISATNQQLLLFSWQELLKNREKRLYDPASVSET